MNFEFCTQLNRKYEQNLGIIYIFRSITTMETVCNLGRIKEI
jgi:hypothetical protein